MLNQCVRRTCTLLSTRTKDSEFIVHGFNFSRNVSLYSLVDKVYDNTDDAVKDIKDGSRILFGGFGLCGMPENLIRALVKKNVRHLHIISNDAGLEDAGLGLLVKNGQVDRWIGSYIGENPDALKRYASGDLELKLVPQGSLAERLRAGGAGIPAFYTPTGYGTLVQHGGFPVKYNKRGKVVVRTEPKEFREFDGVRYIMEKAITGDFSIVKAWKGDRLGNLIFRKSARNFNSVMCMACPHTIAEVEEIMEPGELNPDEVHVCGIYVQKVVKGEKYEKRIHHLTTHSCTPPELTPEAKIRQTIAKRTALEFKNNYYVNLGVGMPTGSAEFIPADVNVHLQSENGIMRLGPFPRPHEVDSDVINAGKQTVTVLPGGAYFGSEEGFAMIRGNHLDITVLGAMQVSMFGDLANWMIPGKRVQGMGGAMDLVSAHATKVIVNTAHNAKDGTAKIVEECTLPLTGKNVVDLIITEKAVFTVSKTGLTLIEYGEGFTVDDIRKCTDCIFDVCDDIKQMGQVGEPPSIPPPLALP